MRIVVIGIGEVGRAIAGTLEDTHEVVVIDYNKHAVEEMTHTHDVLAIHGDGRTVSALQNAGVDQADIVIACTDDDEVNTVICSTVKALSTAFTIARVRYRTLFDTWRSCPDAFGVDHMVCTNLLTSEAALRIAGLPAALEVDTFASGLVRMATFEIESTDSISNQSVSELDRDGSLTIVAVFRADELVIPDGDTTIQANDRIVVIGSNDGVSKFARQISMWSRSPEDEVIIVGATEIGLQTAQLFEKHDYHPRLIERNSDLAREAAELLPNTTVLNGDPANIGFLRREHTGEADILIAASTNDEENLLTSLVASQLGVSETVTIVENLEYTELFRTAGVDVTINPREETAEEIIRFTRLIPTEKIVMLEHDQAEVIEIEVTQDSILADKKIVDSMSALPDGVVIGAIARTDTLVVPRGSTVIEPGDHVIMFVDATVLTEVTEII